MNKPLLTISLSMRVLDVSGYRTSSVSNTTTITQRTSAKCDEHETKTASNISPSIRLMCAQSKGYSWTCFRNCVSDFI